MHVYPYNIWLEKEKYPEKLKKPASTNTIVVMIDKW